MIYGLIGIIRESWYLIMYVRCNPNKKNVKYLSYVEGYRDENGITRQKTIKKIGDWDTLIKLYDDPIAHFNQLAKSAESKISNIKIDTTEELGITNNYKNFGYCIIQRLYDELQLAEITSKVQCQHKTTYSIDQVLRLLVYSRILCPASKNETYNSKGQFFEKFDFSLKQLYRSLDFLAEQKEDILKQIWVQTKTSYERDNTVTYYDCTNYYFEISYNDEDLIDENGKILEKGYRKKGVSKEHRKTPIIQMGLLMDKTGIPLNYEIFPGNESEKTSLLPLLRDTKRTFDVERTILVADRGLNTSDNTYYLAGKNDDSSKHFDGYVYGQSVRGANARFKEWVLKKDYSIDEELDEHGNKITFKHKSRLIAKDVDININNNNEKSKAKTQTYQLQMVYYSEKYAKKQRKEREIALEKANSLIQNPAQYTRATSYGASKYVKNLSYIKDTGEIADSKNLSLNEELVAEEALYDGYYSIVTSETKMSDKELRDIYRGLWKIEESFKVTKSTLETRPVYVWTNEHIEAHFLTCFISLVMIRLLEKRTAGKFSAEQISTSLKNYICTKESHDIYKFGYRDEVIVELEQAFNINLNLKYQSLTKMKEILNPSKKGPKSQQK